MTTPAAVPCNDDLEFLMTTNFVEAARVYLAREIAWHLSEMLLEGYAGPFAHWRRSDLLNVGLEDLTQQLLSFVSDDLARMHIAGSYLENLRQRLSLVSPVEINENAEKLCADLDRAERYFETIEVVPDSTFTNIWSCKQELNIKRLEREAKSSCVAVFFADVAWRTRLQSGRTVSKVVSWQARVGEHCSLL